MQAMDEELVKMQNKPRGCCAGVCSSYLPEHLRETSWECDKKWQVREKLFSMCHAASSLIVKKNQLCVSEDMPTIGLKRLV